MLKVNCPTCGKRLKVPDRLLGKRIGCSGCRSEVEVTSANSTASPDDSAPLSLGDELLAPLPPVAVQHGAPRPLTTLQTPKSTPEAHQKPDPDKGTLADRLMSWAFAILIQAVVFTCIAFAGCGNTGATDGPGGEAGFAEIPGESLTNTDDGNLDDAPAGATGDPVAELTTAAEVTIAPPTSTGDGIDLSITITPSGGASGGGGGSGDGFGFGGKGGGGEANFLGTAARGNRFCIIADNSGSMAGPPLEYVKAEILKTVGASRGTAKFHVVFFSDRARDQPLDKWISGKNDAATLAQWVSKIGPEGGTSPIVGFDVALKLDPPPDVIYFMTDGGFDEGQVRAIAQLNSKLKKPAVIHTIAFLDRSGEQQLKKIALDGNGTYRFVAGFNRP